MQPVSVKSSVYSLPPESFGGRPSPPVLAKTFLADSSAKALAWGISGPLPSPSGCAALYAVASERHDMARDTCSAGLLCALGQCSTVCTLYVVICAAQGGGRQMTAIYIMRLRINYVR